jgi:PAS domain S-box-containing protein
MKRVATTKGILPDEMLRDSEARYRWLFESTAIDGIIILDAETGLVVDVNPFLLKLLGFSREQIIKKKIWELGFFKDILASKKNFQELLEKGFIRYDGLPLETADGLQIDVEFIGYLYKAGNQRMIQCSIRDITERKWAEQKIANLARFPSENPNPVLRLSRDGIVMYANVASGALLGLWGCAVGGTAPQFWRDLVAQALANSENKTKDIECDGKVYSMFVTPIAESDYVNLYARDVTERRRAEATLRESEERFRTLVENSTMGLYRTTPDGRIQLANPALVRMLGYSSFEDLSTRNLEEKGFEPLYPRTQFVENIEKDGEVKGLESAWKRKDETIIFVRESAHAIRDSQAKTLYYEGTVEDITERIRAEKAQSRAEENFRRSIDESPIGIRIVSANGETLYVNRAILNIYGYDDIEELRSTPVEKRYTPASYAEFALRKKKRMNGEDYPSEYEISIIRKTGEIRRLHVFRKEILWDGLKQYQTIYQDVTERARAEQEIKDALQEKEALLREIHHRVKNNMQVISSLFHLQAGHPLNEDARAILKEAQVRIQAMSLVHEKLYKSAHLSQIDFGEYINSLALHLFHVYGVKADLVRLETEFEDVNLDIASAMPCGLILNELISNALKYAFPGNRAGVVRIALKRGTGDLIKVLVADDGIGFPEGLDFSKAESFGLQIVNLLVGQLDGTIELDRTNGTAFTVSFYELKYPARA